MYIYIRINNDGTRRGERSAIIYNVSPIIKRIVITLQLLFTIRVSDTHNCEKLRNSKNKSLPIEH